MTTEVQTNVENESKQNELLLLMWKKNHCNSLDICLIEVVPAVSKTNQSLNHSWLIINQNTLLKSCLYMKGNDVSGWSKLSQWCN